MSDLDVHWAKLYLYITAMTGWTPFQINQLTLNQLEAYLLAWQKREDADDEMLKPDYNEIQNFNLNAGIKRIIKEKK